MKNNHPNPDHNLWNNNGTFWCHYTVHNDDYTKQRVRVSLGTKDVAIARALRDFLMQATPKIASKIPSSPAQSMPDTASDARDSRAVVRHPASVLGEHHREQLRQRIPHSDMNQPPARAWRTRRRPPVMHARRAPACR